MKRGMEILEEEQREDKELSVAREEELGLTLMQPDEHLRLRIPLDGQDVTILVSLRGLNGAGREIAVASATVRPRGSEEV